MHQHHIQLYVVDVFEQAANFRLVFIMIFVKNLFIIISQLIFLFDQLASCNFSALNRYFWHATFLMI